jgi:hypothetical protein
MNTEVESHRAQAAVGSAASGRGSGGTIPESILPVAVVTGSKVVPHSAQTWLKQQFGVQL